MLLGCFAGVFIYLFLFLTAPTRSGLGSSLPNPFIAPDHTGTPLYKPKKVAKDRIRPYQTTPNLAKPPQTTQNHTRPRPYKTTADRAEPQVTAPDHRKTTADRTRPHQTTPDHSLDSCSARVQWTGFQAWRVEAGTRKFSITWGKHAGTRKLFDVSVSLGELGIVCAGVPDLPYGPPTMEAPTFSGEPGS